MKQIDYLKLIATGRKSVHYARPSDADDALTGLVGLGFVIALALTWGIAILVSYLGQEMNAMMVAWPLAAIVFPGIAYFVCGLFIGGAPGLTRYGIILVGATVGIALLYLAVTTRLDGWYLFAPAFLYSLFVAVGATRQL